MEVHSRARRSARPTRGFLTQARPPAVDSAEQVAKSEPSPLAAAEPHFLSEPELAHRWGLSPKTLQRWRGIGVGPVYVKFSRRVAYPLEGPGGILDLEQHSRYRSTRERVASGGRE